MIKNKTIKRPVSNDNAKGSLADIFDIKTRLLEVKLVRAASAASLHVEMAHLLVPVNHKAEVLIGRIEAGHMASLGR